MYVPILDVGSEKAKVKYCYWEGLKKCVGSFSSNGKIMFLDLNAKLDARGRETIGVENIPGVNYSSKQLV